MARISKVLLRLLTSKKNKHANFGIAAVYLTWIALLLIEASQILVDNFALNLVVIIEWYSSLFLVLPLFQGLKHLSIVKRERSKPKIGKKKRLIRSKLVIPERVKKKRKPPPRSIHKWIKKTERSILLGNKIADIFDEVSSRCADLHLLYGVHDNLLEKKHDNFGYYCGLDKEYCEHILNEKRGFIYFNEIKESLPVIFDSGASISVTPNRSDFNKFESISDSINGITSTGRVTGCGTATFLINDDKGNEHEIETFCFLVPEAKVRLLCVQECCSKRDEIFTMRGNHAHYYFNDGGILTFRTFNVEKDKAMLPIAYFSKSPKHKAMNVLADENCNLTTAQKEVLGWHYRLGHFHTQWIQQLLRRDVIHPKLKGATNCPLPMCEACRLAKAKRLPDGAIRSELDDTVDGTLKQNNLRPGSQVSTDQYVSSIKGRLPTGSGRGQEHLKYSGGTIYVDHATSYMFVENQVSLNAAETIRGKHKFEREMRIFGNKVHLYRGDNGIFQSREYKEDLKQLNQQMVYSGVGAHHQNGVAERAIRTVSDAARAMLIHSAIHWPEETNADLWPFAMKYAVYLWNNLPKKELGRSPIELLSDMKDDNTWFKQAHVFGCPAYVLDPTLQDGKKLPRWKPKSRRGQFLGRSEKHASSIGLIRNIRTGNVSTQFHVVYDDFYTTVAANDETVTPDTWNDLIEFSRENLLDELITSEADRDIVVPPLANEWLDENELNIMEEQEERRRRRPPPRVTRYDMQNQRELQAPQQQNRDFEDDDVDEEDQVPRRYPVRVNRNARPQRYFGSEWANLSYISGLQSIDQIQTTNHSINCYRSLYLSSLDDDNLVDNMHPFTFAAQIDNDTLNFHEALNGPDAEGFYQAMEIELETLESLKSWDIVPREAANGYNILQSTWTFKRKRYPDGSVKKLKARFCVRGYMQQESIDYFDTYSPVVAWTTIRILLVLTAILGLATKQVDYTLAFCQAKLKKDDPPIFIEMPRMFETPGHILRLNRSLYGMKQSPLNFYNHLTEGLEARGFKSSKIDPCLWYNDNVICLIYVDDCLFFSRKEEYIDKAIVDLRTKKDEFDEFLLNIESDVAGFLGILFKRDKKSKSIELTQTGLIKRILKVTGLEDSNQSTRTPAEKTPLGKDENGDPCQERFEYSSVVGMLQYLANNSRPDIAYAVNQCARFTHQPKRSHEKAIKRIARYLSATRDKGLIMKPSSTMNIDLYADADFAGLWNSEDKMDPICVKSRTGFLITLGKVPLIWGSRLQSEIALSTMESEYIALSTAMRDLVLVRQLYDEIKPMLGLKYKHELILSRVYEDNQAALILADSPMPKMTPRSKHIAVKYHWFRRKLRKFRMTLVKIISKDQLADIFTKGLTKVEFERLRKALIGW